MERFAYKVFYLGQKYQGFQRQPSGMAVENFLEFAMISGEYIQSFKHNAYQGASRTDANVSALNNIIALNCEKTPNLDEINHFLPKDRSILIHAYANVGADFLPRSKNSKTYEYWVPPTLKLYNPNRIFDYEGENDFSAMIKKDGAGEYNPVTIISKIEMQISNNWTRIRIKGDSFGREQIRRMIGLLLEPRFEDSKIELILLSENLHIPSAPPQFLFLADIEYSQDLIWKTTNNTSHFIENMRDNSISNMYDVEINKIISNLL